MNLGFVVIGRNEGSRLVDCLASLAGTGHHIVYVDSGSTDQSLENARAFDAEIIDLDVSLPFTAARARNAGLDRLIQAWPDLQLVHFIDGDCTLIENWLDAALARLSEDDNIAVVCGRLRERHPEQSVFNALCEREWDQPPGEVLACGGIALMRISVVKAVGAFNETLIAGEEPELCLRIRQSGYKIWRLADDMAWHDAALHRFGQWWRRMLRGGHAYAEISSLHFRSAQRIWISETVRALLWGLVIPVAVASLGLVNPWLFAGFLIYPLQVARIAMRENWRSAEAWRYGLFMTLAKFAEAWGILTYLKSKVLPRRISVMEYKK